MGPGPINADPRVLRAMSAQLLGQFDPQFRAYMKQTMALYRRVFETANEWTFVIDGTARAGDRSRDGLRDRAGRPRARRELRPLRPAAHRNRAPRRRRCPRDRGRVGHGVHARADRGRRSETLRRARRRLPGRYLDHDAAAARRDRRDLPRATARCYKSTPPRRSAARRCGSMLGASISRPRGCRSVSAGRRAPRRSRSRGAAESDLPAPAHRRGRAAGRLPARRRAAIITSNYFDLAMLMDYWSDMALNHHTEATSMLYAARECARIILQEGLERAFARHALAGSGDRGRRRGDGPRGVRRQGQQDAQRQRRPYPGRASTATRARRRC